MKYLKSNTDKLIVLLDTLELVLKKARSRWPKMRAGFCFVFHGRPHFNLVLKGMIGKVIDSEIDRYHDFADEKASRLTVSSGMYYSSYQTRKPELEKYGGAIRGKNFILSISGLASEHEDEAVAMATLILCKEMDELVANDLAESTGNKIFAQLLADCRNTNSSTN